MPKLKLFAALREAAGASEAAFEADTLGALLEQAGRHYGPEFSTQAARATIALNGGEVARAAINETKIGAEDEVALLPPVSGGME